MPLGTSPLVHIAPSSAPDPAPDDQPEPAHHYEAAAAAFSSDVVPVGTGISPSATTTIRTTTSTCFTPIRTPTTPAPRIPARRRRVDGGARNASALLELEIRIGHILTIGDERDFILARPDIVGRTAEPLLAERPRLSSFIFPGSTERSSTAVIGASRHHRGGVLRVGRTGIYRMYNRAGHVNHRCDAMSGLKTPIANVAFSCFMLALPLRAFPTKTTTRSS